MYVPGSIPSGEHYILNYCCEAEVHIARNDSTVIIIHILAQYVYISDGALYFPMDEIVGGKMVGTINGTVIRDAAVSGDAIVGLSLYLDGRSAVSYGRLAR